TDDLLVCTQCHNCRRCVAGPGMFQKELDFLAHYFFGRLSFTLTLSQIGIDDIAEVVDVVKKNVTDLVDFWIDVSGNGDIDDENRTVLSQMDQSLPISFVQNEGWRARGADDDICAL